MHEQKDLTSVLDAEVGTKEVTHTLRRLHDTTRRKRKRVKASGRSRRRPGSRH